ncbi:MAG TPA: pyridoxal phosphate-dependent aminotransferase [Thermoplasmata archaeon]|nr:pyridoxal phosphate-dependent aminotransferase [Thermoplasmata archaeon]
MTFPLGDWVLDHPDVPHNLALSGMKGSVRTLRRALRARPPPDLDVLRARLGRLHGAAADRVFMTHGATESNGLILRFLAARLGRGPRAVRLFTPRPEYPPIRDAGEVAGFRPVDRLEDAEVVALSSPRNPLGTRVAREELREFAEAGRPVLVDQTFREFTDDPAVTRGGASNVWLSGSFTKVYGADDIRVGYAIAPTGAIGEFSRWHALLLDRLPPPSVSAALAILAHRSELLAEVRGIFRTNLRYLHSQVDGVPDLASPVWFDRGTRGLDGDRLSRVLLRAGVLVCSGSFFREPRGIRLTLTRRSFPADLDAYLRVVERD